jgi:hypothetical protein
MDSKEAAVCDMAALEETTNQSKEVDWKGD